MEGNMQHTPDSIRRDYWNKIGEFHRASDDGMQHGCSEANERATRAEAHAHGAAIGLSAEEVDALIAEPLGS